MTDNVDICGLIFKQIDRPKNFEICKAINVYNNKYRVNIYTRKYDKIYDIDKVRITESYFVELQDNDKLVILA